MQMHLRFQVASVSKQFTAMGIMILKEQHKLSFDDSVRVFFPDFPYPGITIRNLLNHTSGLPDFFDGITDALSHNRINGNRELYEALTAAAPPAKAKPYERWEYNNIGYELLAMIIEKVSGLTYNEYLRKYIFDPVGMCNTLSANTFIDSSGVKDAVLGYTWVPDSNRFYQSNRMVGREDSYYLSGMEGDGSLYSTVDDLYKWDRALTQHRLVSRSTLTEAFTPAASPNGEPYRTDWGSGYGFGWDISADDRLGTVVAHGGGQTGYRSAIRRFLRSGHVLIILCNIENEDFWGYSDRAGLIGMGII